jgi:hypothetical protein
MRRYIKVDSYEHKYYVDFSKNAIIIFNLSSYNFTKTFYFRNNIFGIRLCKR